MVSKNGESTQPTCSNEFNTLYDAAWKEVLAEKGRDISRTLEPALTEEKILELKNEEIQEFLSTYCSLIKAEDNQQNTLVQQSDNKTNFGYLITNPNTPTTDLFIVDLIRPKKQLLTLKQQQGFDVAVGKHYLRVCFESDPIYLKNSGSTWHAGHRLKDNREEAKPILTHIIKACKTDLVNRELRELYNYAKKDILVSEVEIMRKDDQIAEERVLTRFGEFVPRMIDLTQTILNHEFE